MLIVLDDTILNGKSYEDFQDNGCLKDLFFRE